MGPVPFIVLPFMSGGDLLTHIQQKQSSFVLESGENEEMVRSHLTLIIKLANIWCYKWYMHHLSYILCIQIIQQPNKIDSKVF